MATHNKKRPNPKGFRRHIVLLVVIVAVAIAGIGAFVYSKSDAASAGGWTFLTKTYTRQGDVSIYACKRYVNAYGGVYQVTAQYRKSASTSGSPEYALNGYRPKNTSYRSSDWFQRSKNYANKTTGQLTINLSIPNGDKFGAFLPSVGGPWRSPDSIANC